MKLSDVNLGVNFPKRQPCLTHLSVVREATKRGDVLHCEISFRRSRCYVSLFTDAVDFFIHLYHKNSGKWL